MWNAERPLYFDIFFQTGFTPRAGPRQRDRRFTATGRFTWIQEFRDLGIANYYK